MFLSAIWWFSSPPIHFGSWLLFAWSSLLPCVVTTFWSSANKKILNAMTMTRVAGSSISIFLAISLFEMLFRLVGLPVTHFLPEGYQHSYTKANSQDRTYWYYTGLLQSRAKVTPNSWGFLGPEPDQLSHDIKILLLSDYFGLGSTSFNATSILPENFTTVGQSLLNEVEGLQSPVTIINASMPGYSIDQIARFYKERLKGLPHNILVFVFHLDDINRELNYRKNHILYSPKWPEWMQDFYYYGCYSCKWVLNRFHFTNKTFQWHREKEYDEAFPKALQILDALKVEAKNRGAILAVFNIPRFYWKGPLLSTEDYIYIQMNHDLQAWCAEQNIPLYDLLPQLIEKNIEDLVADSKIYFTEKGHQLVAEHLKEFILTLMTQQQLQRQ